MTGVDFDRGLPVEPDVAQHDLEELLVDESGRAVAVCSCGWESPGCPGEAIAAEVWAEHLGEQ